MKNESAPALAGQAVVAIWHDVRPESRTDYYEWHNREHMPERVGIPGFLRGRRYVALEGRPEFFTLYEAESLAVLTGPDYAARLNHPTPWTRRMGPQLENNARSLCSVALSLGTGQGGLLMTLRYDVAADREEEQRRFLVDRLPALAGQPGVVGVHLCLADRAASAVQTEEKKGRPKALVPGWVVLVEGASETAALDAACRDALPSEAMAAAGALTPIERGLYRLQNTRSRTPGRAG
ncbi:MAG TPA: hypothetical protein VKC64_07635 [Burkholderiales bacterium]|nr:hypothetical protein [Burkholderiales bacterium]